MRLLVSALIAISITSTTLASWAQPPETEEVTEAQPVLTPPSLFKYVQADYPKQAFEEGVEAQVVARLDIDENGLVIGVVVTEPAGMGFDEAAEDAMYQFVFEPATSDGVPIPAQVIYKYTFFIQEDIPVPAEDLPPPVAKLSGVVTGMDGVPIPKASVLLIRVSAPDEDASRHEPDDAEEVEGPEESPGGETDAEGKFTFDDLVPGSYQVDIIAAGFKPFSSTEDLVADEERELIYRLEVEASSYETVVRARRPPREVTRREITRREIVRIPGTGGDALRSVQNLPGMARASMGSGELIVRGSSPGDSRYYFDQMPVPMLYHFGGLTSVINSDLLERIDFYPGNYGVRYGGATGGVVDVGIRAPAKDRFHGSLDADLWDVSLLLETPINEDWSIAASGRRSYIDGILNAVIPEDGGFQFTVAPRYWDYQLIVDYHPMEQAVSKECLISNQGALTRVAGGADGAYVAPPEECKPKPGKDHLRLFVFGSDDKMIFLFGDDVGGNPNFGGGLNFRTYFHQAQLRWDHKFSNRVSNHVNLGSGYWGFDSKFGEDMSFDQWQVPIFVRDELNIDAGQFLAFHTGLDMEIYRAGWNIRAPMQNPGEGENFDPLGANDEFLETTGKDWYTRPGWFGELELKPVDNLRLLYGLRIDYYGMFEKTGLDPRFVTRWEVVEGTTLKGGLGLFHQAPAYADWDDEYGNPNLDLIGAVHYSLGFEQRFLENFEVGVEGFYKDIFRLVVGSNEIVERNGEMVPERYSNEGKGKVYGLEFLLKHHPTDRFFGWIAYTLMKSERVDHPGDDPRSFDYDQTHILNVVASLVLGRGWEAGIRYRLVTGNPDTPILGSSYDGDSDIYWPLYGNTNSDRLPMFHQLDVRIDKKWQIKRVNFSVYIDVRNIYNNKNVEGYSYNYDYTQKVYFYGLPILPSLGLKIEY